MKKPTLGRQSLPPPVRLGGVVLSRTGRSESDLVVTFLTREQGTLTAVARNARQSVRRYGGNLLRPGTAAYYYFQQRPNSPVAYCSRGEHNPLAPTLPHDPVCSALAAWALELIRAFEVPRNAAAGPFNLLVRHLGALALAGDYAPPSLAGRRLSLGFTKRYLELAGFGANLECCGRCGVTGEDRWSFDPREGTLVCGVCSGPVGSGLVRLPVGLAEALRGISDHDLCPELTEEQVFAAESLFLKLATYNAGRLFKSRRVLHEILGGAARPTSAAPGDATRNAPRNASDADARVDNINADVAGINADVADGGAGGQVDVAGGLTTSPSLSEAVSKDALPAGAGRRAAAGGGVKGVAGG
ncbi:MAG: DNA repair protein RecO [Deltaproteobacteria bacterium]|jgi:DNA repair protein RecO (recombination protein O)|nr:DNA repair protein RecO [Deltaproteobacteria bacterium]